MALVPIRATIGTLTGVLGFFPAVRILVSVFVSQCLWRLYVPCRCYVNPMTCQHKPFLANNGQVSQAWDSCMGPGMNTTIDSGDHHLPHLCIIPAEWVPCCPEQKSACVAGEPSVHLPYFC